MQQISKAKYLADLDKRQLHIHDLLKLSFLTVKQKQNLLKQLYNIERIAHNDIKVDSGVQWKLNGAEDFLCTQYDGEVWSVNEVHPKPVQDTHPNCVCELVDVEIVEEFPLTSLP
jgi:hypothetical protein